MPAPSDIMKRGSRAPSRDEQLLMEMRRQRAQTPVPTVPTSPIPTNRTYSSSGLGQDNLKKGRGGTPLPRRTPAPSSSGALADLYGRQAQANQRRLQADYEAGRITNRGASSGLGISTGPDIPDYSGDLKGILGQIMALTSKPDIPGQWISPYSQDYLNSLGDRMTEAGLQAQQAFEAANEQIAGSYARGVDQRAGANQSLRQELSSGLANLGLNYESGDLAKQAATNASELDEIARLNQATDLSFGTNLGNAFAQGSTDLGRAAREGLLTPKEYIGPQSGLSSGDEARLGFLRDQYMSMLGQQGDMDRLRLEASQSAGLGPANSEITGTAQEDMVHYNPAFSQLISRLSVSNPQLADYVSAAYDRGGGEIPNALKILSQPTQAERPEPRIPEDEINLRRAASRVVPQSLFGVPVAQNIAGRATEAEGINRARMEEFQEQLKREEALRLMAQNLLRSISQTYGGATTRRTVSDKSKYEY